MVTSDPTTPADSRFSFLLARLAAEHEDEVQTLRAECSRLAEAVEAVNQSGCNGEQALQKLREDNSKLLAELLAWRAHGAAKQERALESHRLQAASLAAEQEPEHFWLELAASQGSVQLVPGGDPPVSLPGCVEVMPQESGQASTQRYAETAFVGHTPSLRRRSSATSDIQMSCSVSQILASRLRAKKQSDTAFVSYESDESGLETKIEKIALEEKIKQLERLVEMFDMEGHDSQDEVFMLPFNQLEGALKDKGLIIAQDRLQAVLLEIARVSGTVRDFQWAAVRMEMSGDGAQIAAIDLEMLVDIIVDWKIMSCVGPSFNADVRKIRDALTTQDLDEVIGKVTRLRRESAHVRSEDPAHDADRMLLYTNIVVSVAVLCSIFSLGVSMDYAQGSVWWVVLEVLFGVVFVGEVLIKCQIFGVRAFFCGRESAGNWFDFAITLVAILDVTISTVTQALQYHGADQQISAARISLVLRCVRLAKIARLVKLFRAPCMKELANMLSGFFIGVPSLMWVMLLLGFVIYILALALKSTAGPVHGQDLQSQCGLGDEPDTWPPGNQCQACKLYAEEFLNSVPASMVVVFRCMVGDCTSKAGQSLSAHMSECYGWKFDIMYFLGMVAVIFGLFNIITAVFLQATMDGLQFNHVQNKYAQVYESHYMHRKLHQLVDRVETIYQEEIMTDAKTRGIEKRMTGAIKNPKNYKNKKDIMLSEGLFYKVIQDTTVNALFEDLDVKLDHRINTFQLFDLSNDGRVSLVELIQVLMKMRGEPHKSDLVACWALLEEFRNQFQDFQKTALNNQMNLLRIIQGPAPDRKSA